MNIPINLRSLLAHVVLVVGIVAGVLATVASSAPSASVPAQWIAAAAGASAVMTALAHIGAGLLNPAGPAKAANVVLVGAGPGGSTLHALVVPTRAATAPAYVITSASSSLPLSGVTVVGSPPLSGVTVTPPPPAGAT